MKSLLIIFAFLAVVALLCAQTNQPSSLTPTTIAPPSPIAARLSALVVAPPTNPPSWSARCAITLPSDPSVVGINVYIATNKGVFNRVVQFGKVSTFTLTNIVQGTNWFQATCRDAQGVESDVTPTLEFWGWDEVVWNNWQPLTNTDLSTNWYAAGPVQNINVITNPPGNKWFVQQRMSQVRSNYARQRFLP